MRKLGLVTIALVALAITAVAVAAVSKETYSYKATLTAKQEVPKPKASANAGGVFTATVTENGAKRSIRWKLTFHNLSGKAVAAHIHIGKPGVAGGVLLGLCGPCKNGATGNVATTTKVGDTLEHGKTYVNVHTAKNGGGEIRGAVKLVAQS
jgi:hypothetical protein